MRKGWKKATVLALAAVTSLAGRQAFAQVCFPPVGGVPGATGSGPPDWWTPGATLTGTTTTSFTDDPRWRGALSDMGLDYERFRVLVENTGGAQYLVMSWEMNADLTAASDRLYFGFWDDASGTGNVYRLTRNIATQTTFPDGATLSADNAFSARIFKSSGASGSVSWAPTVATPPFPLPTWLSNDTRVDVDCDTPPSTDCKRWAFRIRAKIDPAAVTTDPAPTGIKISNATPPATRNFHFWYELQDGDSTIGTTLYAFPGGLSAANDGPPPSFPDPANWRAAQLGSGSTCEGDILFDSGMVYVNSTGSTTLDMTSNAFHATPLNNVPAAVRASIPNASVSARFRIANWGSAGFNSPEWRDTCTSPTTAPGSAASGTSFDLPCTWTGFDSCPYKPAGDPCGAQAGTKDPHQCVLVDLGLPSGSGDHFVFSRQSVFRNMNFDVNSTLVRKATIDIKGLGPMPGGATVRDVYLYVHTRNLPAKIDAEPAKPPAGDKQRARIAPPRERFKELELPATGPLGVKESARIQAALQAGRLTLAQVEQLMPTYIVYVWHDTGKTIQTPTGPSKLLEAQPSFGLFLAHDGALEGWEHQLTAAGAVQLAPNFYKISAPNDSTFTVTATISPIECTGVLCKLPSWVWVFIAIVLLILLYLLFRKKPAPPPPGP